MKAVNIEWNVDDEDDLATLPEEIIIPSELENEDDEMISDYLSDATGFCHKGFSLEWRG